MCLIVLALNHHPDYPLILLANRDEFRARPSWPLHWWEDPAILAGRDEQAGGTWLGVTRDGRFAALTNVREGGKPRTGTRSRGRLLLDMLDADDPLTAVRGVEQDLYDGYNLLTGILSPTPELLWTSNRSGPPQRLPPGIHGLSNAALNTPWPKVRAARAELAEALKAPDPDADALFALLQDRELAEDRDLPATGVPPEFEKALSARFIDLPGYGTRSSLLLRLRRDGWVEVEERGWEGARSLRREAFQLAQ
ncbi:MAG: NRDE family protein [Gammaproteobacteria bacterium]|nr:NRDE family protein [Gammaproteobacteria bacterium]